MPDIRAILVIGTTGQLGQSLKAIASDYPELIFTFAAREALDISIPRSIDAYFQNQHFDLIINCAAYTAVDKAESEPELANQINHFAVKQLAEIAKQQNAKLISISTDYVFSGQQCRPYIESDDVAPQSVYGQTKLDGELALLSIMVTNALIIRTSWVYSEFGSNFVKTMLRLARERGSLNVIFDQVGTPTYAGDLARAIMTIATSSEFAQEHIPSTIYHYSNEGVCSWYDFAETIFELADIGCNLHPIETKDYPTAAIRPHYSLLNKNKIKQIYKLRIPYWKTSLETCVNTLVKQEKVV